MKSELLRNFGNVILGVGISLGCVSGAYSETNEFQYQYSPANEELYNKIVDLDKKHFSEYNSCGENVDLISEFYAEDIEFYHDQGGLIDSKKQVIDGIKNNICGKVERVLVPGSIEVYEIKNFGAIQMGLHSFRLKSDPTKITNPARFILIWKKSQEQWEISRVVSLH
ncbi:nuclear transport factor 2 family protein [Microbulbifer salipaludis]|uniref:Nuclear transport factor 2 family protein n=1 Tax=Microbulbifer salipaludis TaxID=187980 RepID=A0ABS3E9U7_9GAMM|nr:nuclear transport factor 2 family protein [Microbulbifer salipaludis]MBN8432093.1 nuclear transport factor 2 family protein [Microbulbifer salipaludis]